MAIEVSVIIPCFNAEATIQQCIDSVLAQSFENFEILAVDDGSTDGTVACLRDYDDTRLRIIECKVNSGSPAVPRNIGVHEAKGWLIAFLDSDDFWHPEKLNQQVSFMTENGYSFSCTNYVVREIDGSESVRQARVEADLNDLLKLNSVGCSTVVITKELVQGFEFRDCPQEDLDMWLRILRQKSCVYGLNEPLTTYIKQDNSRSRLSLRNLLGFHALFKQHGQVGNVRAFLMIARYVWAKRSCTP